MGKWRKRSGHLIDILDGESFAAAELATANVVLKREIESLRARLERPKSADPDCRVNPPFLATALNEWAERWVEKLEIEDVPTDAAGPLPHPFELLERYLLGSLNDRNGLLATVEARDDEIVQLRARCRNLKRDAEIVNGKKKEAEENAQSLADRLEASLKREDELRKENSVLENERDSEILGTEIVLAEAQTFGQKLDERPVFGVGGTFVDPDDLTEWERVAMERKQPPFRATYDEPKTFEESHGSEVEGG